MKDDLNAFMKKGDLNLNKNYRLRQTGLVLVLRIIFVEVLISGFQFLVNYIIFDPKEFSSTAFFWSLRVIEAILLIAVFLRWYFIYYIISTDAVSRHKGVLFKKVETYDLQSIRSLTVFQGLFGRLFNYGTIVMTSPLLKKDVKLKNINNPLRHAQILDSQRLKLIEDKEIRNITPVI